ncbi:hypothetical protein [Albimonas pacifica]|uniref:Uncharacterized protein n=1 Tax=Albimonas pacifica TaxID=1114924 RepID=A0A1I3KMD1_9RHOB|nr:hypothetical protein [Albimonas pacifica]SFI73315.1 hypothetical protein SAMN05216258_1096 [Albimonas pacifica]
MSRLLIVLACLGLAACASPARDYSKDIVRIRLAEAGPAAALPGAPRAPAADGAPA